MSDEKSWKKKVEKYLQKARLRFENLELINPKEINLEKIKLKFREMTLTYYKDALYFYGNQEYENSLAALEYAEGWLDAGKVLGIFKDDKN